MSENVDDVRFKTIMVKRLLIIMVSLKVMMFLKVNVNSSSKTNNDETLSL